MQRPVRRRKRDVIWWLNTNVGARAMKPYADKAGELAEEGGHAAVASSVAGETLKPATRMSGGCGDTEKEKNGLTINTTKILQKGAVAGFLTASHGVLKLE